MNALIDDEGLFIFAPDHFYAKSTMVYDNRMMEYGDRTDFEECIQNWIQSVEQLYQWVEI
jgi:hypothetical protein